jgi:hypothetical protein
MAALLVGEVGILSGTTQQALADKVGPHPDEDNVKQGAMGEYFSKDGREAYGGTSGQEHGEAVQNYARPGDHEGGHESFGVDNLGENFIPLYQVAVIDSSITAQVISLSLSYCLFFFLDRQLILASE